MRGSQPGERRGGRQKGTPNKASAQRQVEIAATGQTPLDFLIERMRDQEVEMSERISCAKAAAPYVHPRTNTTTLAGPDGESVTVEIDGLELARRIALILSRAEQKS
jgi:hypothetical protein